MSPDQHAAFAAAITATVGDPARAAPVTLVPGARGRRFDVYRNNVAASLAAALAARFPVCEAIVGAGFFAAMARAHIAAHPPASPLLFLYGDTLPQFLEGFPPVAGLPYLADMARLEIARSRAFHAADAAPLGLAALAELPEADLPAVRLAAHPAAALVDSAHPVATILAMHQPGRSPAPIDDPRGEAALVTRPDMLVVTQLVDAGTARLFTALASGVPFAEAAALAEGEAGFDLPHALALLFDAGAFAGLHAPSPFRQSRS